MFQKQKQKIRITNMLTIHSGVLVTEQTILKPESIKIYN